MTLIAPGGPAGPPPSPADARPWVLAPGVLVARRSATELQVGHDGHALVVADRPGVAALLDALAGEGAAWVGGSHDGLWSRLLERMLVVPATALAADLAAAGDTGVPGAPGARAAAVAAAYAARGVEATTVLARRRSVVVAVTGHRPWAAELCRLLDAAGVRALPDPVDGAGPAPDLCVLVDRAAEADDLVRRGLPHLLVAPARRGAVRVGPFVDPGATACLRCLTAARADLDPAVGVVELQHARAAALPLGGRPAGTPRPEDPTLVALAVGWAARDVLAWADGGRPSTWSATVLLEHAAAPAVTAWRAHPRCGCVWDEAS